MEPQYGTDLFDTHGRQGSGGNRQDAYAASIPRGPDQESCREQERKSFVERVYSGATGDLIAAFLKEEKITPAERERLRKLLDEMEV